MHDQHAWPRPGSRVSLRLPTGKRKQLIVRDRYVHNGTLIAAASSERNPAHLYVRPIDAFVRGW